MLAQKQHELDTHHKQDYHLSSVDMPPLPLLAFAGSSQFDEAHVGSGGAGYLWELNVSSHDLYRMSLNPPPHWEADVSDTSDEASVATVEDIASDALDPPEGASEVSLFCRICYPLADHSSVIPWLSPWLFAHFSALLKHSMRSLQVSFTYSVCRIELHW